MAFVNILQVFYPVGSCYFSSVSTSPASIIGGSWTAMTGGVLGLAGSTGIAAAANNGGSRKISINQLPAHNHTSTSWMVYDKGGWSKPASGHAVPDNGTGVSTPFGNDSVTSANTGGGQIISLLTLLFTDGEEFHSLFGGDVVNGIC